METDHAVTKLFALAHATRLNVFRLLIRYGHDGLRAGEISRRLDIAPSNLTAHLTLLVNAGLLSMTPRGRAKIYAVRVDETAELIDYLVAACCDGHPDVCEGLAFSSVASRR